MDNNIKIKKIWKKLFATMLASILLCAVFFSVWGYIYKTTEDDAFDDLHLETKQIKETIELQVISDIENLSTMARFASKLYSNGENFDLMFKSFKPIGLIENIGIYMPDGMLYTKSGSAYLGNVISFSEEAEKGTYISGRIADLTVSNKEIVRASVPVELNGETIAILYGVIELDTFREKYQASADAINAELYIIERENGDFIVDTLNEELGNISITKEREYKRGFSYLDLKNNISDGKSGYSAFMSKSADENLYVHYSPMEINGWTIMLSRPEHLVFKEASKVRNIMLIMYGVLIFIMIIYILFVFDYERKETKLHLAASKIRKLLLGINQKFDCINNALENITDFVKSRSVFFIDTDDEDYNYINPSLKKLLLDNEDREYFKTMLLAYADEHRNGKGMVYVANITVNPALKSAACDFYDFLIAHKINSVYFAAIADRKDHISVLGAINPKRKREAEVLLKDISVCFSMAVYNKKHLVKTVTIAITDSLTGLSNRMAYKKDVEYFDTYLPEKFSCIYIDVNELHFFNNKFGHAAGDSMLLYIAETIGEVFIGHYMYRMGGDEFLVFTKNMEKGKVEKLLETLIQKVDSMGYHVAVGMDYQERNLDTVAMVNTAEKRMYEAKARYYQQKEQNNIGAIKNDKFEHIVTGIRELDATLSIVTKHYFGIYFVSLKTDEFRQILVSSHLKHYIESGVKYSKGFSGYIEDMIKPDFKRPILNFLEYGVLKKQLSEGYTPSISYTKNTGEEIILTVYSLDDDEKMIQSGYLKRNNN